MKTSTTVALIVLAATAAFLLGGWSAPGHSPGSGKPNTRSASSRAMTRTQTIANADAVRKTKSNRNKFSADKAAQLTPDKRVALLKKAAVLADTDRQSDILCGLISAMTQVELMEGTKVLLDAQNRGNGWSQAVWNTLWTQWGRVNAEACLALSKEKSDNKSWNGFKGLNTPNDYRCMMAGWLETNPQAAMGWARQAKDNVRDATGAALAITSSAKGDLKQMEAAILTIAGDKLTTGACFHDYFDLAGSTGDRPLPSAVYDRLDPKLRAAAWPVVMERLSYTDPQMAATWLEKHAGDPGSDFRAVSRLVSTKGVQDPEGTAEWAVGIPISAGPGSDTQGPHPAVLAINLWLARDPAAANAWLHSQPANSPWLSRIRPQLKNVATE